MRQPQRLRDRVVPYVVILPFLVFLWAFAWPAALIITALTAICLSDEFWDWRSDLRSMCWQPDEEIKELETLSVCRCHERMGNDFWFLPANQCPYNRKCDHGLKRYRQ